MWTKTFRSTCWDKMGYSRDLLGGNTGEAKKWRGTRRRLGNPQILIQISWLWRRAGRNEGINLCEATSSCLPLSMQGILPVEPSHFLFNLVSGDGFSHICTLTSIFPPGTFTLVTPDSWLGYEKILQILLCSSGRQRLIFSIQLNRIQNFIQLINTNWNHFWMDLWFRWSETPPPSHISNNKNS